LATTEEFEFPAADTLEAPPPDLALGEATDIAERLFGLTGTVSRLDSERDQNFRLDGSGGSFVLKVSNPAERREAVEFQVEAMRHIASVEPGLPVPRVVPAGDGKPYATLDRQGVSHLVHVLTFLDGQELAPGELDEETLVRFGALVARLGAALRGFFHPAAGRELLWDVKQAARLRPLVRHIGDQQRADLVSRALDAFEKRALPALSRVRSQVVHGDLTLTNVLFDAERVPSAVIDFGDVTHTPLICDLGVAIAAVLRGGEDSFDTAGSVLRGYGSVLTLEKEEARLLPDLVAARQAAAVAISAWRVGRFPANAEYITALDAGSWAVLELFDELGHQEVARRFSRAAAPALAVAPPAAPAPASAPPEELAVRRRRLFGAAHFPLSYDRPLHLVRGEGVWLTAADGRRYLDAYNNVPVVGHSHPRVVEALARQARLLNTNTRYLHETALELVERLTATLPAQLDTCMFVNSGSEANDLAWRLAVEVTGARGALVSEWAYHGVTEAIAALSPSEWPAGSRPEHVRTVRAPHAAREADELAGVLRDLEREGLGLAALLLDSAWTSDGIFTDAGEDEAALVAGVRADGGLFVADEVQAGFGRLGARLWSFEHAGMTPDFVTLGKPIGNGHPVAAVVTRAAIADEFASRRAPIFSTFGGNPVACAAALAVLDVLEEERLVESAAAVGAHLRQGLEELGRRYESIGAVRGDGLLLGVELTTPEAAHRVVNGMRDRGVLIGSCGPRDEVLKIRPPLPFERRHAELLLEALDATLGEESRGG
jgi:4-aminobutyrate aminotransferase-like enzyme/Ser/Thr protein kinase RdoA (MazF antagonist)